MKKTKLLILFFMLIMYFFIGVIIIVVKIRYKANVTLAFISMVIAMITAILLLIYSKPVNKNK